MAGGNLILNSAPTWQKPGNYKKGVKRTKRRRMYSKKGKNSIVKIIDERIQKKAEPKHAQFSQLSTVVNDNPAAGNIYQVVPNISEVFADNGRNGNAINPTSLRLKLCLWHLPPASINTDNHTFYAIRVMIVQPKQFRGLAQIQSNSETWLSTLLRDGGTTVGFNQASMKSILLPINSDAITTYYDKVYYEHFPRVNASTTIPTSYVYAIEESRLATKTLNINMKVKNKIFHYDALVNSGLTPDNYNPVLIIGVCNVNGYTQTTSNMTLNFSSTLTYRDY